MKNKIIIIFVALLLVRILSFAGCIEKDAVKYKVTFDATWSEETHPDDFPPNPHFSGLIGASHNENVVFWRDGELASSGIKNMAETGSKNPLNTEILKAIMDRTAFKRISGGGIGTSPGSVSIELRLVRIIRL